MNKLDPSPVADKATRQVSGTARYIDDLALPAGCLRARLVTSPQAHARVLGIESSGAVDAVVVPLTDTVEYVGQPVVAVAAETVAAARAAAENVTVHYEPLPAVLDVDTAIAGNHFVGEPVVLARGDATGEFEMAPNRLHGRVTFGAQEHFYLECQSAVARPNDDGTMTIVAAAQSADAVRQAVAERLDRPLETIAVETPPLGGGYGGKGVDAVRVATIAARLAAAANRPVALRLDRAADLATTGKRPAVRIDYEVGFDDDGRLRALTLDVTADTGFAPGLAAPYLKSLIAQADATYRMPHLAAHAVACRTNRVPAAPLRGRGAGQGAAAIEAVVDHIAHHLALDGLAVRRINLAEDGTEAVVAALAERAELAARRAGIEAFNRDNPVLRKGLAVMPAHIPAAAVYAAAATEVVVDRLTGEMQILRVDVLVDSGNVTKPGAARGQVLGGFVHGQGAMTTEELTWDDAGRLLNTEPSAYPIPTSRDAPKAFNFSLLDRRPDLTDTVFDAKAGGDLGMVLAPSIWLAIRNAVVGLGPKGYHPNLDAPATPECILEAIDKIRK